MTRKPQAIVVNVFLQGIKYCPHKRIVEIVSNGISDKEKQLHQLKFKTVR